MNIGRKEIQTPRVTKLTADNGALVRERVKFDSEVESNCVHGNVIQLPEKTEPGEREEEVGVK